RLRVPETEYDDGDAYHDAHNDAHATDDDLSRVGQHVDGDERHDSHVHRDGPDGSRPTRQLQRAKRPLRVG
ncbi:hypothetical protein ACHAO5_007649, partial [Verticillium nonalfalfae]